MALLPRVCDCSEPSPKLALILYPSLGTPLLIGPHQKKCSLFIAAESLGLATSSDGRTTLDKRGRVSLLPSDASATVARHLRLVAMKGAKPDTDIQVGALTGDGRDCAIAKTAIKVWRVAKFEPGAIIYNQKGEVFATVSPQAVKAFGAAGFPAGDIYEVELDLARLAIKPESAEFKSFAWMVKPTQAQKNDYPSLCTGGTVHAQDLLVETFLSRQITSRSHRHQATNAPAVMRRGKEAALMEYDVPRTARSAQSLFTETDARLAAWHPVIRLASDAPLKVGHLSDVHINVRHNALAKSPAHVIEDSQFTKGQRPAVGELVCNTFNALKALFDQVGVSKRPDTVLLLTGDLIDFNRNIDPAKVPDRRIGEQWKLFNVLNRLNDPANPELYPRGQDDMLAYSLVRYAYNELKLPVFMTTGNHEAYDIAYGVYPRVGVWGMTLGAMEILQAEMRKTLAQWAQLLAAHDACDRQIDSIQSTFDRSAQQRGEDTHAALRSARQQNQAALEGLRVSSNTAAANAKAALDDYLRQTRAGQPKVASPEPALKSSGNGLAAQAWGVYHAALQSAKQTVVDATNAGISALWGTYTSAVGAVGHGAIGLSQSAGNLGIQLADLADDLRTRAMDLGVSAGVVQAQTVIAHMATSSHLAVSAARVSVQAALQANKEMLTMLDASIDAHRKDVEGASKFAGLRANPGISADHNMTVFEATLAYGPTYGQTWTSLNFTTANFDWFSVLFTPLSDFCIAMPTEPDATRPPQQVLVGLAWGETENFMNVEGVAKLGTDRHGAMILPRASASIDAAQQAVLRQALALKGSTNAPLVVASHFTMINYNAAALQEELSFVPHDGPRGLTSAGFNNANFGTCERNLKWYFAHCASVPGQPTRVDWHLSGHSHRSALYTISQGRSTLGAGTVTVASRRDPGMYKDGLTAYARSGTQFVVSSCGGPIGVQNLAGELNGHTLRPPAGSLLDCGERKLRQIKTQRTGRDTGTRYNEVPRLAVALDYLHVLQPDNAPVHFAWESRTGLLNKGRADTVKVLLNDQMKKLDCIAAMKVWIFEGGRVDEKKKPKPSTWHCLTPEFKRAETGGALRFTSADLKKLAEAMVTTSTRPAVGGAADLSKGAGVLFMQRVTQAFCEVILKKPTIALYTMGPEKGKATPDWSADMKWENDSWIFPLEIGTSLVGSNAFDFMQRRSGEHGQVPDWRFLAEQYRDKGYIAAHEVITGRAVK